MLSAQLFSKDGLTFNEDVSEVKSIDPSYEKYFKQAMEKMAPVTFEGTFNKQTATIKYLPFSFDNADDFHRHTVIELIYSNSDLRESEQQVIFLMILTALAGSGLVAVFAFRMSKLLTSPINALYDSMQRISQGDYDSRLIVKSNDEFSAIAKQFNEMTEKIKTSMIDQQQKKQQIEALYKTEASMNKKLQEMMESTKQSYFETIKSLANAEEEKDIYTRGHCDRVTDYSLQIGKVIGLSVQDMDALRFGAILHDIGKIGIPEQILNKESPLTNEEFALIRQHPLIGAKILGDLTFMRDSIRIVHEHHEWYNGHGYPTGIKGTEIDLLARIVCVADAYDAMTTQRPYRKIALTHEAALKELEVNSGIQFDPDIVRAFIALLEQELL